MVAVRSSPVIITWAVAKRYESMAEDERLLTASRVSFCLCATFTPEKNGLDFVNGILNGFS